MRPPFSLAILRQMLIRENDLRLCPETQAAYGEAELREDTDWLQVHIDNPVTLSVLP